MPPHDLAAVLRHFRIDGAFLEAMPHGSGHINHSYRVSFDEDGLVRRYLLQRVNTGIFKQPDLLMENIGRVTSHFAEKLAGDPDAARRVLTLVPSRNGGTWHSDAEGQVWRVFRFIENARTYDEVQTREQAFQAAEAFAASGNNLQTCLRPACMRRFPPSMTHRSASGTSKKQ